MTVKQGKSAVTLKTSISQTFVCIMLEAPSLSLTHFLYSFKSFTYAFDSLPPVQTSLLSHYLHVHSLPGFQVVIQTLAERTLQSIRMTGSSLLLTLVTANSGSEVEADSLLSERRVGVWKLIRQPGTRGWRSCNLQLPGRCGEIALHISEPFSHTHSDSHTGSWIQSASVLNINMWSSFFLCIILLSSLL